MGRQIGGAAWSGRLPVMVALSTRRWMVPAAAASVWLAVLDTKLRGRRVTMLARREAGETEAELAATYGITGYQVHSILTVARADTDQQPAFAAASVLWRRRLTMRVRQRRQALELPNAGAPWAYIADLFGVGLNTVSYLTRMARYDAASSDPDRAGPPVAEPLLDWLVGLSADWVGMGQDEFFERVASAMRHPVDRQTVRRKMTESGWEIRRGQLQLRVAIDTPPASLLRAAA